MAVQAVLSSELDGKSLHHSHPYNGEDVLVTTHYHEDMGSFQSVTIAAAATTVVTSPFLGQSIVVTGWVLSASKSNGNSVTIRMTDGTNTEDLMVTALTNLDINMSATFPFGLRGWENARLEIVTTGVDPVSLTLTYTKIHTADSYTVWDAKR